MNSKLSDNPQRLPDWRTNLSCIISARVVASEPGRASPVRRSPMPAGGKRLAELT